MVQVKWPGLSIVGEVAGVLRGPEASGSRRSFREKGIKRHISKINNLARELAFSSEIKQCRVRSAPG